MALYKRIAVPYFQQTHMSAFAMIHCFDYVSISLLSALFPSLMRIRYIAYTITTNCFRMGIE